jgi:hypothetical protein
MSNSIGSFFLGPFIFNNETLEETGYIDIVCRAWRNMKNRSAY